MFNTGTDILGPQYGFKTSEAEGNFMIATGGTITTDGNYKIHTFTASDNFIITKLGNGLARRLLVGAGGGGALGAFGAFGGSGGGAGEYNYNAAYLFPSIGVYAFVAGVPGNPATVNNTDGTAGTGSSFDGVSVLPGGAGVGVFGNPGGVSPYGIGGASAGAGAIGSNGTIAFRGGNAATAQAGAGGSGGAGGSALDCAPAASGGTEGGAGLFNDITGISLEYSKGGWGGGNGSGVHQPVPPANYGDGGDGSAFDDKGPAFGGGGSVLIIRYQYK